ncbi:MAG: hypothetical protein LBC04_00530 [Holosporaceae bacterium]|jgi:hypothetical protein|nr:hypothetical protein [Holosporaceae bacterium]
MQSGKGGGSTQKYIVDAVGVPVRFLLTDGVTANCSKAGELIDEMTKVQLPSL